MLEEVIKLGNRPSKKFGGTNRHMGGSRGQSGQGNFSGVNRSRPKKKSSGPGFIDSIFFPPKGKGKKKKW